MDCYSRASEASRDSIEMAIRDLDDYLTLFPDRLQAREVRDRLLGEGRRSFKTSDKRLVDGDNLKPERSNCHLRFHNELNNRQSESDTHFRFLLA